MFLIGIFSECCSCGAIPLSAVRWLRREQWARRQKKKISPNDFILRQIWTRSLDISVTGQREITVSACRTSGPCSPKRYHSCQGEPRWCDQTVRAGWVTATVQPKKSDPSWCRRPLERFRFKACWILQLQLNLRLASTHLQGLFELPRFEWWSTSMMPRISCETRKQTSWTYLRYLSENKQSRILNVFIVEILTAITCHKKHLLATHRFDDL